MGALRGESPRWLVYVARGLATIAVLVTRGAHVVDRVLWAVPSQAGAAGAPE